MDLIFETMAGLEDVAAAEIDAIVGTLPRVVAPGRLVAAVPAAAPLLGALKRELRCCDRVGMLLANTRADSLAAAREAAATIPIERHLDIEQSFGVRYSRRGQHDFNRQDLGAAVGAGVLARFRERSGKRPPVDLDNPEVILRAELFDDQLLLWIDAVGDRDLSHRAYRAYSHMASMRPMVANLLLRLAGWSADHDVSALQLIDPFCGSATILIEAVLAEHANPGIDRPTVQVHGVERFVRHVQGAIDNIERAGLREQVVIHAGQAEQTHTLLPRRGAGDTRTRVVVTNPPFGRRVSNPRQVDAMYRAAASSWAECDVARIVTLAERGDSMAAALTDAGYAIERGSAAVYGVSPVTVFVASR